MRIIHRIIATNILLNKMGVTANTQCGFCNDEKDSIEHMFWKCACIRRFWTSLETILKENCETALNVKFTQSRVLFGTEIDIKTDTVFDLVILQAKQFIYKCKLDKCLPTLSCFLQQLMLKYKIDEYNAKISGEPPTFIVNWLCYKPILKTENWWPQGICIYFRFRIYAHMWQAVNHSLCKAKNKNKKLMFLNGVREGLSVQGEQNGAEYRPLGDSRLKWNRFWKGASNGDRLPAVRQIGWEPLKRFSMNSVSDTLSFFQQNLVVKGVKRSREIKESDYGVASPEYRNTKQKTKSTTK